MAKKLTTKAWRVYRQDTPTYVGKDNRGFDDFAANLVECGFVFADTSTEAFDLARKHTDYPVLEVCDYVG